MPGHKTHHFKELLEVILYLNLTHPGNEDDHSPPSTAEVMNTRIYTSTLLRLHGVAHNFTYITKFISITNVLETQPSQTILYSKKFTKSSYIPS
jgi:hypothetical protein